jgi:hypothetical protein
MHIIENIHFLLFSSRLSSIGNVCGALDEESIIFIDRPFFNLW